MPFPTRVISHRTDIDDIYYANANNDVLQKSNVCNLVGLMTQLNELSQHAHEIFTDILANTQRAKDRIQNVRKRVNNFEDNVTKYEEMFTVNAPCYFYDNPYSGREYLRNDPLNGLLFTRSDASHAINNRRNKAMPPTDLSQLDRISKSGACIKQFTDCDFFINEWLENERRKRAEEKEKHRLLKANRKKGKMKRKHNKTIKKLHRKRYDEQGNEIKTDNEPTEIAVTQYQLTDSNRNYDDLFKKANKQTKKMRKKQVDNVNLSTHHQCVPSYDVMEQIPQTDMEQIHVSVFSEINDDILDDAQIKKQIDNDENPPSVLKLTQSKSESVSERRKQKLRGLSANIPMDDISYDIPENAPSPATIYATKYQKRDLENEVLDLSNASNIITKSPPEIRPIPPKLKQNSKLGFLGDITSFKKEGKLKRTQINVNRHKSNDKRTNLLQQLKNNKVKLNSVKLREIAPKKEEKRNLIFEEMNKRRNYMVDSSDSDESDWESESD